MNDVGVRLRLLADDARDRADLQRVLDAAPGYAIRATGIPAGPDDAHETFAMLPPGKTHDDKFVFGIERDGALVGCIDIVRGWPEPSTAVIGLLLLDERVHR